MIQQSLSKTHQAILSQTTAVNSILQSITLGPESHPQSTEPRSLLPWHANRGFIEASQTQQHTISTQQLPGIRGGYEKDHEHEPVLDGSAGFLYNPSGSIASSEPTSPFEVSQNFFPETYTSEQLLPTSCLVVISSMEIESSSDSKTNLYRLFYRKSPRQWCRLSISIKIPRFSIYWAATTTSRDQFNTVDTLRSVGGAALPCSLLTKTQERLSEAEDFDEDIHFRFFLSDQDCIRKQYYKSSTDLFPTTFMSSKAFQEALTFLDDLGCPRYFENEITQIALLEPPSRFAACIHGRLVYEIRFARSLPSSELLYNIRLLHCMNGLSGFANLVGIVVDTTRIHLKIYLIEFPRARWKLQDVIQNRSITWKRREKWAKQLVEGVSRIHSRGFVVGTLCTQSPILIDGSDCVQLWYFKQKFRMGRAGGCYYPPECRHFRHVSPTTNEAKSPNVTSKADIFHLGLVLWRLAENSPRTHNSPVCIREGCSAQAHLRYDESHLDPIALPSLPESIPQYYRQIVDICRAENPNDRLAAWRLLKLFPTSEPESSPIEIEGSESTDTRMSAMSRLVPGFCDSCLKGSIPLPFFHCNVCQTGDFDICKACYDKGIHCYDTDHLLVEMKQVGSWIVPGRYCSSVGSSGGRDFIEP